MKNVIVPGGETIVIQQKPWWLFWLGSNFTITLSPYVYTPDDVYMNEKDYTDIMVHENVHLHQQEDTGKWVFYLKYLFSSKFRYDMEFAAYMTQFKWYLDNNRGFDIGYVCDMLSSVDYMWCVSRDRAFNEFSAAIEEYKASRNS